MQKPKNTISKPVAWVVSLGLHIGLGALAFFITWTVISIEERPPVIVTPQWHEQNSIDDAQLPSEPLQTTEDQTDSSQLVQLPEQQANEFDGFAVLHQISSTGVIPEFAKRDPETEVQFMGLDAQAARKIMYVVDASGSMLLHLSGVLEELERSLRTLHPKQQFGVIFFQQNDAIVVPPVKKLVHATAVNIDSTLKWIRTSGKVIPSGGSNPIEAMEVAVRMKPDVIYVLSENITGAGRYEVPVDELLQSLDELNPIDTRNGLRPVQINCIQYVTEDPMGTMRKIAEIHGGNDGYTFISRGKVVNEGD